MAKATICREQPKATILKRGSRSQVLHRAVENQGRTSAGWKRLHPEEGPPCPNRNS